MTVISRGVGRVSAVPTGAGAGHPEHVYGTRKPTMWWVLTSRRWVRLPVNVFVIEHDDGLVLFDTGPDPAVLTDPGYWPDPVTRFFMGRIFRFELGPEDHLARQLELAGYRAAEVRTVVLSHLHFDHAGGIRDVPQAELLVSGAGWRHMLGRHPERDAVLRRDLAVPGARWRLMAFEPTSDPDLAAFDEVFDVMGDGSLVVLPTPGHLPGSVSMLVRRRSAPPVLLIGDMAYSREMVERDQVAGTGHAKVLRDSYARVRALAERVPGLVVIASHDLAASELLVAAPAAPDPATMAAEPAPAADPRAAVA